MGDEIVSRIAQIIYDKKGFNILALDLSGVSALCDYVVIAEGSIGIHVEAIASAIIENLKELGIYLAHEEGRKTGDWVVLDYSNVMVHLFMPGLREKYQLEKLWPQSRIIELEIDTRAGGQYE